jgi:hypothetical protein
VDRQIVAPSKLSKAEKKSLNGSTTGRVVTSVNKFEVWMANRDKVTRLMEDIEEHIARLEIQQSRAERGARRFGPSDQKRTRSWKQKKNAREESRGESMDVDAAAEGGEESRVRRAKSSAAMSNQDKSAALSALEKKYNAGA